MLDKLIKDAKDSKKQKYLYLAIGIAILGILITLIPMEKSDPNEHIQNAPISQVANDSLSYEAVLEKRLTEILQKMEGVGQVDVMLTTFSDEEKVLAEDKTHNYQHQEEKDEAGGVRITERNDMQNRVVLQSGNTPYIIRENRPQIEGVLVLAEGAENSSVKAQIIESVAIVLKIPVHRVSVVKKQI